MHLSKKYNSTGRREKKLLAKSDWFKTKPSDEEQDCQVPEGWKNGNTKSGSGRAGHPRRLEKPKQKGPSTVMFVPWTVRGILVSRLKQEEDREAELTDFRIKFTEEGVVQLWRHFSTNLEDGLECGRGKCSTCNQKDEKKS